MLWTESNCSSTHLYAKPKMSDMASRLGTRKPQQSAWPCCWPDMEKGSAITPLLNDGWNPCPTCNPDLKSKHVKFASLKKINILKSSFVTGVIFQIIARCWFVFQHEICLKTAGHGWQRLSKDQEVKTGGAVCWKQQTHYPSEEARIKDEQEGW